MAALTLVSKFMGFLREIFLAGFFGTSYITDAYVMASAVPGIIFAGVFTSVSVSYMPIFSQIVEKEGIQKGNRFTSEAINLSMGIALIVSVLGIIFSDQVVTVFANGFTAETAALTSFYLKITFAYVVFTAATGLLTSWLQYRGIFLSPLIAGYLQSGFVLLSIIVSAFYSHYYLAYGLLIGHFLQLVAVAAIAKKKGFTYVPTLKIGKSAKEIMILAVPVFIGSTVNQINSFVDKMLASGLKEGSVAALNYSNLLINLITALTITVIVTIIYPRLTQALAQEDFGRFNDSISKGMNITVIIGLPCSIGAMLYSDAAVRLVYERGAFDAASTDLTSSAFFYYAIGLTFIALNALLVKVYYSMQDMKTPVICGAIGAATNITLNLILVGGDGTSRPCPCHQHCRRHQHASFGISDRKKISRCSNNRIREQDDKNHHIRHYGSRAVICCLYRFASGKGRLTFIYSVNGSRNSSCYHIPDPVTHIPHRRDLHAAGSV